MAGHEQGEIQLQAGIRATDLGEDALGCSPTCPFLDDVQAPPACPGCADPFSDAEPWEVAARDLRGTTGRLARTAEILSSGEPVVISAPR